MANNEEEKLENAVSTFLAYVIVSALVGLGAWSFGLSPKFSLGVGILAFFASALVDGE